jgi:hypothetical protein
MQPIAIKKRKLGWPNNSGNKAIRKPDHPAGNFKQTTQT